MSRILNNQQWLCVHVILYVCVHACMCVCVCFTVCDNFCAFLYDVSLLTYSNI